MSGWATAPLGRIAELHSGSVFPPALQGRHTGEVPFAKVGDISRATRASTGDLVPPVNHITHSEADKIRARILPPGTTVFAKIGEAIAQNYRFYLTRATIVDNNAMGAIPRPEHVNPRYLFYFLCTLDLYALASKTAVPAVRKSELERVAVPLPLLPEQRRIADILDKADAIRRKHKEALVLTDDLLRSTFLEMFGDPVTNPKGWPTRPFLEVADDATGGQPKLPQSSYLPHGEYPVIDQGAAFVGGWTNDRSMLADVRLPAILFGDHTKTFKYVAEPFCLGADGVKILLARPGIEPFYLLSVLKLFPFPDVGYSRHFKFMKRWRIPVAPYEMQEQFRNRAHSIMTALTPTCRGALLDAEALFTSLLSRAFRGELRPGKRPKQSRRTA